MNKKFDFKKLMSLDVILFAICLVVVFIHNYAGSLLFCLYWIYLIMAHWDLICGFMGNLGISNKKFSKAVSWYKTAAMQHNAKAKYVQNYIYCEIKYGDLERCEKNVNKILEKRVGKSKFADHDLADVLMSRALLEWKMGRIDDSLKTLKEANEKNTDLLALKTTTAYMMLIKAGELENATEAYNYAKEVYTLYPNDFMAKSMFAIAAYLIDSKEISEEILSELNEGITNIPDNLYFYGKILEENGEYEKACQVLAKGKRLLANTIIRIVDEEHYDNLIATIENKMQEAV